MFFDDDGESMTNNCVEYVIIKDTKGPRVYLSDYDVSSKVQAVLWCTSKTNAYVFEKFSTAEEIRQWLKDLKIPVRIDSL